MANPAKPRKRRKKRRQLDPQKLRQRKQKTQTRALFKRLGFKRHKVDTIQFTFEGRTGELDDVFVFENIIVICEYTVGKGGSSHVFKKKPLFDKINAASERWITDFASHCPDLLRSIESAGFTAPEVRVRAVYLSLESLSEEVIANAPGLFFLDGTTHRYFQALSKTIHQSARHELFKFLNIPFEEVGPQIHTAATRQQTFTGHLLPEAHSSFPAGFKVVSFYADPETLLALSYVLRQDSWRDPAGLYQRILIPSKIRSMRKYLLEVKRVFVNNIIVTLPPSTSLNEPQSPELNIDAKTITKVTPVAVQIPYKSNAIGLVDGQHRVFCYYESDEKIEPKIAALRKRQNLLVTGLIFPQRWTQEERRRFEAKLFLEINDTQARAKSGLKQSIELVLNPLSTTAVAKEITNRLARSGPLKDLLQVSVFDPPGRIKTTSIVSYGLRPLVKRDGADSLFATWPNSNKNRLAELTEIGAERPLLDDYIQYCVTTINSFLGAVRRKIAQDKWSINEDKKVKGQWLNPTTINGLFVCMRQMALKGHIRTHEYYEKHLSGLESFDMKRYRSSHWNALGQKLFEQFFA